MLVGVLREMCDGGVQGHKRQCGLMLIWAFSEMCDGGVQGHM